VCARFVFVEGASFRKSERGDTGTALNIRRASRVREDRTDSRRAPPRRPRRRSDGIRNADAATRTPGGGAGGAAAAAGTDRTATVGSRGSRPVRDQGRGRTPSTTIRCTCAPQALRVDRQQNQLSIDPSEIELQKPTTKIDSFEPTSPHTDIFFRISTQL